MKKDILYSDRIRDAIATMRKEKVSIEAIDVTVEELIELQKLGFNIVIDKENQEAVINTTLVNNCNVISLKNESKKTVVKWVELNDLYIGQMYFCEQDFRYFLDKAKKEKYRYVYIAGNITAGHPKFNNQSDYLTCKTNRTQVDKVVEILSDYPCFEYFAVHGVSDCSFEKYKEINPLYLIQKELRDKGISFNYIPDYTANFVIEGVVKRVTSIKSKRNAYTISYPMDLIIRKQFENMLDNVIINSETYKLAFLQFGNIKSNTLDYKGTTYLTSSSGYLFDSAGILGESTTYPAGKLCIAEIKNEKVLKFSVRIIEMPYDQRV